MYTGFNLNKLVRDNIRKLTPYSSARNEFNGKADIVLDANENPIGSVGIQNQNRYPDPYCRNLKLRLSLFYDLAPDRIFTGNGSDEIIDLLFRALCRPGLDKAVVFTPSYGMYRVCAELNDTEIIDIRLDHSFDIDLQQTLQIISIESNLKLLFICSPNNPTGNSLSKDKILEIAHQFQGLVVIDEAYVDFSNSAGMIAELQTLPNVFLLRTFSKAWGLASIRLGIGLGSREIIRILNSIKLPYNVNGITQAAAAAALVDIKTKDQYVDEIIRQRNILIQKLSTINCIKQIYPTSANFILVKFAEADQIYEFLKHKGIIVRNRSTLPGCKNCLRITIGTDLENMQLIRTLKNLKGPLL